MANPHPNGSDLVVNGPATAYDLAVAERQRARAALGATSDPLLLLAFFRAVDGEVTELLQGRRGS